jgi:branched-subunit amino acid ABC-type transport system permease component
VSQVSPLLAEIPIWDWHWQWWVDHSTWQLWFDGLSSGMVFGLLAMGIVLIYRSTKVINLAVGNMGLPAMLLMALMVVNYDFPYWIALIIALFVGLAGGAVIERTVIRRLFDSPRVIVLVATIGIAQLMTAIMFAMPDPTPEFGEGYPVPLGSGWEPFWGIHMSGPQVTIMVVAPVLAVSLALFLNRTVFGQTVQASATNPDLARLQGIDPKTVSLFVWTVAGGLAAVSMMMLAGDRGQATGLENLGPVTMTRALAAAVLAGMYSFPRAIVAGLVLGVVQAHITFIHLDQIGLFDLILLITVVIAVVLQTRTSDIERSSFSFVSKRRPVPEHLRSIWWIRHFTHFGALALLTVGIVLPLVVSLPSRHFVYATILAFSVCAVSVSIITGWAGQVSLAQMAFAGFGAFLAAGLHRGLTVGVGWGSRELFDFSLPDLPYVLSMFIAALLTALVAAVVGVGSLRVRVQPGR